MNGTHVIIGTRPEATKGWLVVRALAQNTADEVEILFSGQHRELLAETVNDLSPIDGHVPRWVDQSQRLEDWRSTFSKAILQLWRTSRPRRVCVVGDTDTVRITSEIAHKLDIPIVHIEAGIRHNSSTADQEPEEKNRRIVSGLASLHLAPTQSAIDNLLLENVQRSTIRYCGDLSYCSIAAAFGGYVERLIRQDDRTALPPFQPFVLCTFHRSTSLTFQASLEERFIEVARQFSHLHFVVVSRPDTRWASFYKRVSEIPNITVSKAMPPSIFLAYLLQARIVLTDSAGVQQEALILSKPVIACRANVELYADDALLRIVPPPFDRLLENMKQALEESSQMDNTEPLISSVRIEGERIAREAARMISGIR